MVDALEDRTWLARVLDGDAICGAAFAVDSRHVLSCAHVVEGARATPGELVWIDFPALAERCQARVLGPEEGWAPPAQTSGDVAVLRMLDPPAGICPLPLRPRHSLAGLRFTAYGFPDGYDYGVSAAGVLGPAVGEEWVQMEIGSALSIGPGFSGAAVWSEDLRAAVAMIVTRDGGSEGRAAFALPVAALARRSAVVSEALPSALDLDPALATHWSPRARGVSSDAAEGWLFSGRRRALSELVAWLGEREHPGMRIVSGAPGSGKSAVLARLATTADRHYRARMPPLDPNDPTVPPLGSIDVTFHARDQRVEDFLTHLAAAADLPATDSATLLDKLAEEHDGGLTIVVDALDEALEARELAWLACELVERGNRVLVGCRAHIVRQLAELDAAPIALDAAPYLQAADVKLYVKRLLGNDRGQLSAGDRDTAAGEIARAARGNFLVAQLLAHTVMLGHSVERPFPRSVHQAFERLLAVLPNARATHELLLALAHARGDGLPRELWLQAAGALCRPYRPGDLDELLSGPAASFLVTALNAADGRRYRLFHQALQETLLRERDISEDNRRLWQTWREALPGGARQWQKASSYLHTHAAEHAAAAGELGELLGDPAYLLFADLPRLATQIAATDWPSLHGVAAVVRMAAPQAQPLNPARRATMLALAARHMGYARLAEELLAAADPRWRPRWAHSLGRPHQRLVGGHSAHVEAIALGRLGDEDVIVSGDTDGLVCIWDAAGRPLRRLRTEGEDAVKCLAIGRHGGQDVVIAVGRGNRTSYERIVQLWSAEGDPCGRFSLGRGFDGHDVRIDRLGGRDVLLGCEPGYESEVCAWDLEGHRVLRTKLNHLNPGAFRIARLDGREILVVAAEWDCYTSDTPEDEPDQEPCVGLWDERGEPLSEFAPRTQGHFDRTAVAAGRLGRRDVVLTSDYRAEIHRWSLRGKHIGEPLQGHRDLVFQIEIAQLRGRDVVLSFDKYAARLWDAEGEPIGAAFTSRGSRLTCGALGTLGAREVIAAGDFDGAIRLWDLDTEVAADAQEGHEGIIAALAAGTLAGRETIVSGGAEGAVRLWDRDGRPIGEPPQPGSAITGVAIGPPRKAGEIIVSCSSSRVTMPVQVGTVRGHAQVVLWDKQARLAGRLIPWDGYEEFAAVAAGRLGRRLVVVAADASFREKIFLWSVRGEQLQTLEAKRPACIALGRLGDHDVLAARSGECVRLWNAKFELCGELSDADWPVDIAIGRWDGQDVVLAANHDGRIRRWDAKGRRLDDLAGAHDGVTTCIVLGRMGEHDVLACGREDGTVCVREPGLTEPETIDTLEPVRSLAIAPTRLYVATGSAIACFSSTALKAARTATTSSSPRRSAARH